jgi:hypothetical protein
LSPTATSTAVKVPLVEKFSEVVLAELMFPDAVTLDCTVPRATVAVSVVATAAGGALAKTEFSPSAVAAHTAPTSTA